MGVRVREASQSPCINCTDRWVTDKGRCHTSCQKYAAFRQKVQDAKDIRLKERKVDTDVYKFMSASAKRQKVYVCERRKAGLPEFGR